MSKRSLELLKQERINNLFENIEFDTSEFKFQQASSPTGWTWECDQKGNYLACSAEIESVLNISLPDILGKPVTSFMVDTKYQSVLQAALKNKTYPVEVEIQFIHADGRSIQARVCILKPQLQKEYGNTSGFSGFTHILLENQPASTSFEPPTIGFASTGVIQETPRLGIRSAMVSASQQPEQHQNLAVDLYRINAAQNSDVPLQKYRFLTEMGMELRTSVNSILGFSRVILKGIYGPINDPLRQDIRSIYDSGVEILDLTDDIIDFSKLESGLLRLNLEANVNLADIIISLANTTKVFFQSNAIELIVEIPSDLLSIHADPIKTRKILLRMLTVAAKLTKTGIIRITAENQTTETPGNKPIVRVSIDGEFLLPVEEGHLFNPFLSASESIKEDLSSGKFGLYTAKKLVEMHGGQMGVQYEPGKSCKIYFTLPVDNRLFTYPKSRVEAPSNHQLVNKREAKAITRIEDAANQTTCGSGQSDKNRKILLIDDDRANIDLIKEVFVQSQEQLVVAPDGTANIMETICSINPSAIIINPQMQNLDIQQVLGVLKIDHILKSIPIIILTSNSLDRTIYHSINNSAIVLHKGLISGQDFINRLHWILRFLNPDQRSSLYEALWLNC